MISHSRLSLIMSDEYRGTKRKRTDRDTKAPSETIGATISRLRHEQEEGPRSQITGSIASNQEAGDGQERLGTRGKDGWQEVDRATRRKMKKLENNYPALTHSATSKLQSFVKISDLQSLVLYILADGPSPQWISVRHHQNFDKMVVLMMPGLDADLFTGAVPLEDLESNGNGFGDMNGTSQDPDVDVNAHEKPLLDTVGTSISTTSSPAPQRLKIVPDGHFPSKLATQKLPGPLRPLCDMFTHLWPIKTPGDYKRMHSPMYAILSSPIPRPKEEKNKKGPKPPAEGRAWKNKRTPITEYVATKSELLENGYALHPAHLSSAAEKEVEKARRYRAVQSHDDGFVDILDIESIADGAAAESQIEAGSVLQGRQLFVMDCEMVTTNVDRFALARVSIMDWDGKVVLDEFVKPPDPIKDYLTPYSGITKEMMDGATLTLLDVQAKLRDMLTPQAILAGHSLDSDLRALKMSYPFIVDTSLLYPHPKGPPQKSSLKFLSQKYLGREIQQSSTTGHDSVEDAKACLDLIRQKCEKGKAWGTGDASGESIFKRLARTGRVDHRQQLKNRPVSVTEGDNLDESETSDAPPRRTSAIVDWTGNMHGFAATAAVSISCTSDAQVVSGVIRAVNGDDAAPASGPSVPRGGCDFTFARLRELEFARAWSPSIPSSTPSTDSPTVEPTSTDPASGLALSRAVSASIEHIRDVYTALPPRTGLIVFSGSGPPGEMLALQKMLAEHKAEFLVKKWDELSVRWTDVEEQALKKAVEKARLGVGFVGVK